MTIDRKIKRPRLATVIAAIYLLACLCAGLACSACSDVRTREIDTGNNILLLTCPVAQAPRRANIAWIIEDSGYWVSSTTRERMFQFAKETCGNGSLEVRFVLVPDAVPLP